MDWKYTDSVAHLCKFIFLGSSSISLSTGAIVTVITFVIIALIATP